MIDSDSYWRKRTLGKPRCRAFIAASTLAIAVSGLTALPAGAHHECAQPGYRERSVCVPEEYEGDASRDVYAWTPRLGEHISQPRSWRSAWANNTQTYNYMYATGGREFDDYAIWSFKTKRDGTRIRGTYGVWVRVPQGGTDSSGRERKATATVQYAVLVKDAPGSNYRRIGQFTIDQRRQKGWVKAEFQMALTSPEEVRISISDYNAWPDIEDSSYDLSRVTADAVRLRHEGFLDSDKSLAQLRCAADTEEGRTISLGSGTDRVDWSIGASASLSLAATAIGQVRAVALNPAGAGFLLGLAVGNNLSMLLYGEDFFEAWSKVADTKRRQDVTAAVNGAVHGGRWQRAHSAFGRARYFSFGDPGPCELFSSWAKYLPEDA